MGPHIQKLIGLKQNIHVNFCCITHAVSQTILNIDPKNLCRDVNKLTINSFFNELGLKQDSLFYDNKQESMNKLNSIMPVLNSVHLWGRYKQAFDPAVEGYALFHSAPLLRQNYNTKHVYRNVNWIYAMK